MSSDRTRLRVILPSVFVTARPKPPEPPPVPGTVSAADLAPPSDPPRPFLVPWATHRDAPRDAFEGKPPIPVDVDADVLEQYLERHDVRATLEAVFKDRANAAQVVEDVMRSMRNPFRGNDSSIVWTLLPYAQPNPAMDDKLGGKKLKHRHRILTGQPWSIATFCDSATGLVRRNMVYDGEGNAIAQVDFGHGKTCGLHCHALVLGNLEHTAVAQEDHLFRMLDVPWMWLCCPWEGRGVLSAAALPPTVEDVRYSAVALPFEDYSEMGDGDRSMT